MDQIIHPELDPEGRAIVEFMGQRKSSVAKVKVIKPGSGKFVIQHVDFMDIENDITYFFEWVFYNSYSTHELNLDIIKFDLYFF